MAFVSPSLVARIYTALGQNRGADAVLLLRQYGFVGDKSEHLVTNLLQVAQDCQHKGDFARAEEHFRLALALYQLHFVDLHADALQGVSGLIVSLISQKKFNEVAENLKYAEQILKAMEGKFPSMRVAAG